MVTPGGIQKVVIINESALYSLILSSKLPQGQVNGYREQGIV